MTQSVEKLQHVRVLNANILSITQEDLLRSLQEGVLITPNVDHLVKLQHDRGLYDCYQQAEWVVCDSRVLRLLSFLIGRPIRHVVAGSDFFPAYCQFHQHDESCRIFVLGGLDDTAMDAQRNINQRAGRQLVVGACSPSLGFETNREECERIVEMINASGASTVLVGLGCPKQEKWIFDFKKQMPQVKVWMALGATVDFEAGHTRRAPKVWRVLCMEWLHRFLHEPKRLYHRYWMEDMKFFVYLFKQLIGTYKNPFAE